MKLKSDEITARLQNGPLPPAILLYGQEQGLITKEGVRLRKQVIKDEGASDFDAETFFSGDLNQERFISACQAFPFLSEKKFILLKGADKIDQEARKNLLSYLKNPSETTLLVVQAENLEAKNPLRKGFETSKTAWAVPFYPLDKGKLGGWIRQQLQNAGYQVDNDALQYLTHRLNGDTMAASSELEKLQLYLGENRQISLNEVMAVVGETVQYSSFGLTSATTNGQTREAMHILDRLLAGGEQPLALLGILTMRIRQIIQGQALLGAGENPKMVARKLRIFWLEERAFIKQCHSVKPRNLANALLDCLEADKGIKSGGGEPKRIMGGLIMRISGRFCEYR
jgi:DNA polymerase III subunit delta